MIGPMTAPPKPAKPAATGTKDQGKGPHVMIIAIHPLKSLGKKKSPKSNKK